MQFSLSRMPFFAAACRHSFVVVPSRIRFASSLRDDPPLPVQLDEAVKRQRTSDELAVTIIDPKGKAVDSKTSRYDLALSMKLPIRDLRCLSKSFDISQVLVREGAIILNLKYLRAVITTSNVLLFGDLYVSSDLVEEVQRRIRNPYPSRAEGFEMMALEGMLHYMDEELQAELQQLSPLVYNLLDSLEMGNPSEGQLRSLLNMSKKLGALHYDTGELKDSLDHLLTNDEDLAHMYLTPSSVDRVQHHEEVEILLENYARRLEEASNTVSELRGYISATEAYLKIRYDGQRNKIMKQTLILTVGTFSVACGTIVSSAFGMNLLSHMESHPSMFWMVFGGVCGGSTALFLGLIQMYKRNRTL